jgi:hypothetical protein
MEMMNDTEGGAVGIIDTQAGVHVGVNGKN